MLSIRQTLVVLLLPSWPGVNYLSSNMAKGLEFPIVCGLIVLSSVSCFVAAQGLCKLFRFNSNSIASIVGLGGLALFSFQFVRAGLLEFGFQHGVLITWAVLTTCLLLSATFISTPKRLNGLAIFAVLAWCGAAIGVAVQISFSPSNSEKSITEPPQTLAHGVTGTNVYYFIIDAYGRHDQLKRYTGHDNLPFINSLTKRGFSILDKSRSNYTFTDLSVPSTLAMKLLSTEESERPWTSQQGLDIWQGKGNTTFDFFKNSGYSILTTGSHLCSSNVDRCLLVDQRLPVDVVEYLFLTPIPVVLNLFSSKAYEWLTSSSHPTITEMPKFVSKIDGSHLFLLSHIMEVHNPTYNEDCSILADKANLDLARQNYDDRMSKNTKPYISSLICSNTQILKIADIIQARDPSAIVVFSSDHGASFSALSGPLDPDERLASLSAWRLPASCNKHLYPEMTNVNHFRLIKACLTNTSPEFVPDRVFVGSKGEKVTEHP